MLWLEIWEQGCDLKISQPGANHPPKMTALLGGYGLVGLVPAWESQLILRCFLWEVQELLSLSWKDFLSKKKSRPAQSQFVTALVVRQGVGDHYTCAPFLLFSVLPHCKLLSPQVKFKQIWEWEGKWVSEIPSKAFKLGGKGERGERQCKSWGKQPTFVLMLPRAACVCVEGYRLLIPLQQDPTLYLSCISPPSAFKGGFFFPPQTVKTVQNLGSLMKPDLPWLHINHGWITGLE